MTDPLDALPKDLPEQSEVSDLVTQQRIQKERKSDSRFPLNVFVDCVGADGIKIMGRELSGSVASAAAATHRHRRKYPPLSRERLEAFLAMTRERSDNKSSVLGAITWDHGTVLFPLGDDLEEVAGFDGGSGIDASTADATPNKQMHGVGVAATAPAAAALSNAAPPPVVRKPAVFRSIPAPTEEQIAAAREEQRQKTHERQMRIANGNFLPPPPPPASSNNVRRGQRPLFTIPLRRVGGGVGGGGSGVGASLLNDDDDSEVSSPTFAPTEGGEFPATATATSLESAHSSDMARADAAAIEAATRGLNPMSAQAAVLRAAAIHRREQRLKRRKECALILSNLERHEKYGLAAMTGVVGSASPFNTNNNNGSSNQNDRTSTPVQQQQQQIVLATPQRQYLTATFVPPLKKDGGATAAINNNNDNAGNSNNSNSGVLPQQVVQRGQAPPLMHSVAPSLPRVGSRSSVADTATEDGAASSSMPDLMSATPSEAGGKNRMFPAAVSFSPLSLHQQQPNNNKSNNKQQIQGQRHSSGSSPDSPTKEAPQFVAANSGVSSTNNTPHKTTATTASSSFFARGNQNASNYPPIAIHESSPTASRPPPPPFSIEQQQQQQQSSAAAAAKSGGGGAFSKASKNSKSPSAAAAAAAAVASSGSVLREEEPAAVLSSVIGGNGLSEADLLRLQKQEQATIRARVTVDDFGNQKGRGVRSNAIFSPGDLIFRVRPDLGVVYSDYRKLHCAHCFRPSIEGRTVASSSGAAQHVCLASTDSVTACPFCDCFALCSDCGGKNIDLASLEPKAAGFPTAPSAAAASSSISVPISPSSSSSSPPPPINPQLPHLWQRHMLWCRWLRTLSQSVREGDTDYLRFFLEYAARVQSGDVRLVENVSALCSLEDAQSADVKQFCDSFSALIWNTFSAKGLAVSRAALREAMLRVKCNALGFPFTREATIGWATHGTVCMINHSCDPNAALTQSPLGEMEVRAIREIPPGQEVTISYLHLPDHPSKQDRRRHLLTQYRFLCRCELCERQK